MRSLIAAALSAILLLAGCNDGRAVPGLDIAPATVVKLEIWLNEKWQWAGDLQPSSVYVLNNNQDYGFEVEVQTFDPEVVFIDDPIKARILAGDGQYDLTILIVGIVVEYHRPDKPHAFMVIHTTGKIQWKPR